jgi:fermentation-respiration switch protein FrsA (DUF1100 family)
MRWSITSAALLLAGCSGVFLQPDRRLYVRPEAVGAKWEEARFPSIDKTALTGLWFPSRRGASRGVVIQFHGNGENMTSHFLSAQWLALEGWDVLAFDYRGYGASGGRKSLAGSVEDGVAALRWARAKAPGRPLVVLGQSLGGALAVAALDQDGGEGVAALVLDSTFDSYRRIARDKLRLSWITSWLRWPLSFLVADSLAPDRLIARRKRVPLLVLHAPGDPVVPYERGRRLYELAPGPKELWDVPGQGHTEALGAQGADFRPRLLAWLNALPPAR